MNIGMAARRSGVPAKTIRYYEDVGLIPAALRSDSGYRKYSETDVRTLQFVQRARGLGFSVKEVARLLALWRDQGRASGEVKALTLKHVAEIDAKLAELRSLRATLLDLAERCHGDHRPDCPILEDLAGDT